MPSREDPLSAKLRALRAEHCYTQAQVAERLNISQQTYSNYENRDAAVDSKVLKAICELYDVSADYLLDINVAKPKASEQLAYFNKADDDMLSLLASKLAVEVKTFINKSDDDEEEK